MKINNAQARFVTRSNNCYNITDVSGLGNVHELNLSWCNNIRDVSALGNVHELNLTYVI